MKKLDAKDLISRYLRDELTPEESKLVEAFFIRDLEESTFVPGLEEIEDAGKRIKEKLLTKISDDQPVVIRSTLWPKLIAAAAILIFFGVGFFLLKKPSGPPVIAAAKIHDIPPGGNRAILTLANGKQIILSGAKNGMLARQGNIAVNKTEDGKLVYDGPETNDQKSISYNTMSTPRGGQYQIRLSDGTNVWLNAASSIKYPTTFSGDARIVEITGEAYFEVAHNKAMPFRVISKGQVTEVLGTHFNINSYDDEPVAKTTLFEGSVKISNGKQTILIKPGEQAVITRGAGIAEIQISHEVNEEQILAWKNGEFSFDDTDIQTVMRQIGRWYNVEITYETNAPSRGLSGTFSRNMNASKVLQLLSFTGIKFKIEGKKIIVK
jgi:transmembrane sensor